MGFDVAEVEREAETAEGEEEGDPALAQDGEEADEGIAEQAEGGDGEAGAGSGSGDVGIARRAEMPEDAVDGGIGTAIDGAAVPVSVDVAGLGAGGVMDVQSEGGDDDSG